MNHFSPAIAPLGPLWLSALVALLPLVVIFVGLGVLKWKAHVAGLAAVLTAIITAVAAFKMPVTMAVSSGIQGFVFGLFPIAWIVLCAVWFYELTVVSGRFEDLRGTFDIITDDPRIMAILIAFCFGGMLEALAGFGAPVAITGVMLMAVGYPPMRAACTVLLANTAPVAFGAIATPIITAGKLTGIDYHEVGAYVGHVTPVLSWFVPLLLVALVDGKRGLKECWHIALTVGISFSLAQWVAATWISVELTDVIASLVSLACAVILLKFAHPKGTESAIERLQALTIKEAEEGYVSSNAASLEKSAVRPTGSKIMMALFPYLLVIVVFSVANLVKPVNKWLKSTDLKFGWPGLKDQLMTGAGKPSSGQFFSWAWLSNPGTLLLLAGIVVALVYKISPADTAKTFGRQVHKMRFAFLTIGSVLALAYVMNFSGQTITIGTWIAGTGAAFAFLSPILGWIGTAVTGSDTSANALFATLQQTAAQKAGIDPTLLVASNTAGGVIGKMISPQNLTIACTAVGLLGKESDILRKVMWWSVGLLVALCLLIGLQSTPVLSWMLP